jgi:Kef-type K+ transport system membrane component KefB
MRQIFGIILFFFMLGIDLELSGEALAKAAPMAVLIALLTVFVFPMIMWMLGTISGLDGRTCFLIGQIINQVGPTSGRASKLPQHCPAHGYRFL